MRRVEPRDIRKAQRVKFSGDSRWWDVRDSRGEFVICTREAFLPKGEFHYTIVDLGKLVRGSVNLTGGEWSVHMTDEDVKELLDDLTSGEVEVSSGNRVPLRVEDYKTIGGDEK